MRRILALSVLALLAACGPDGSSGETAGLAGGATATTLGGKVTPSPAPTSVATPTTPPNVIVFLVDDLGWKDVGFMGSTFYNTPNIDGLASKGMVFDQAYSASPVCSPSRAALMSGMDPARLGMTTVTDDAGPPAGSLLIPPASSDRLELSVVTLAERFKAAGYATMFAGKWHLAPLNSTSANYFPEKQGFDVNFGGTSAGNPNGLPGQEYYVPYRNNRLKDGPAGEYLTDRLGTETVNYIHAHQTQPFFIEHAFYGVHTPLNAVPRYAALYDAKVAALGTKPEKQVLMGFGVYAKALQNVAVYGEMVSAVDDVVGRVLAELAADKLTSNTIIVFTSDNGGLAQYGWGSTSNAPLRAGKAWLYEGGIRVPLAIVAPGRIQAGTHSSYPTTTVDLVPTLLHLANIPSNDPSFDGVDLFSPAQTGVARDLFWHYPHYNSGSRPVDAVRSGNWKMVEYFEDDRDELFDLSKDPYEERDVASKNASVVSQLRAKLTAYRARVGARLPTRRP